MKEYNFDEIVTRRGTNCVKWDEKPPYPAAGQQHEDNDIIPLWVADMDFRVAPAIQQALERRVAHGVFGYNIVPESYYQAVISWFRRRHGWTIQRQHILYTTAVVPAMSCVIKALTMPGEKVLILSPAYNCFFSSIRNNGCQVLESPLKSEELRVKSEEFPAGPPAADGRAEANSSLLTLHSSFQIDWAHFEACCADEKTTLFLLCNPHNPCGRVWTRDELQRMADICHRHHVAIVSDEIHCELIMPGHHFVPMVTVAPDAIVMNSPSKNFNTAGLQIANIICPDDEQRRRIDRAININEVCDVNPFGIVALEAAYNDSEQWLNDLCQYLWQNYLSLCHFAAEHLPQWKVCTLEGTYLPWVDVSAMGVPVEELCDRLLREARVWVNPGTMYGPKSGRGYIRLNIACPRALLTEALQRISSVV